MYIQTGTQGIKKTTKNRILKKLKKLKTKKIKKGKKLKTKKN